jgi:glycogen operon protein
MQEYRNDTGTGNVLRTANRHTRKLVMDSLRYWVQEMHVDGFRFDLASIFTRNDDGSINLVDPPIVAEITSDPILAPVRLIGETWDMATYQLGRAFPGINWMQWNGKFRDDIRRFVKSDNGMVGALITRLYGSSDLYADDLPLSYRPFQSVNFVTAHDGFCLYDLVSYNSKHNQANGHNNTDGTDDNASWNCGWEGDSNAPPEVVRLRTRQIKNFVTLLMFANGTPMFCMGDEFMHTQHGNNNPFNQDNNTTWLNWDLLTTNQSMFRFFKLLIALRKAHPSIARGVFWRQDVSWYGVGRDPDLSYFSHTLAYCLHGASVDDRDLYVMINAYWEPVTFTVQEGQPQEWRRVVDTFLDTPQDILAEAQAPLLTSLTYTVQPRSVVVLVRR